MININDANADVLWENEKTENFLSVFRNSEYSKIETPKFVPGAENLTLLGDSFHPDNHYNRSINRSIDNDLYGHCNYVSGLHVVNPLIPSTIDRNYVVSPRYRRIRNALKESEYQFHTNGNSFCGDKLTQVPNPVKNTLTDYYSKKQKYALSQKKQQYSDLLSLANTDSVIAILERELSQDDKGICIKENTCAISNLSQLWRAKKRQNDENRMGILHDDDGHEIDPLGLLMINDTNNDLSNCIVKILKKQDAVYSVILDLYIQGYTQLEISGQIGKSLITVKRLFKALSSFLAPLADDIADYIRLQDSAPSYAWASSHRVNLPKLDRSITSASLPGVTSDNSCKDKTLQWLFSAKKDITKIS